MKQKVLQGILETIDGFENPNINLEQYATSAEIAANLLHIVGNDYDEIAGRLIADLGCGCGMLSLGASILDAGHCVGFDIDVNALNVAKRNKEELECDNIDFINCDVLTMQDSRWHKVFDTVIMNPPFGTQNNQGTDLLFLETALSLANHSVYSLHKSSTRRHIKMVSKTWNVEMECLAELRFDLPKTYKKHKRDSVNIEVDLLRFTF